MSELWSLYVPCLSAMLLEGYNANWLSYLASVCGLHLLLTTYALSPFGFAIKDVLKSKPIKSSKYFSWLYILSNNAKVNVDKFQLHSLTHKLDLKNNICFKTLYITLFQFSYFNLELYLCIGERKADFSIQISSFLHVFPVFLSDCRFMFISKSRNLSKENSLKTYFKQTCKSLLFGKPFWLST